eukprot:scaffold179961_cov17-Tisochrysis_lutea.AAC.1
MEIVPIRGAQTTPGSRLPNWRVDFHLSTLRHRKRPQRASQFPAQTNVRKSLQKLARIAERALQTLGAKWVTERERVRILRFSATVKRSNAALDSAEAEAMGSVPAPVELT